MLYPKPTVMTKGRERYIGWMRIMSFSYDNVTVYSWCWVLWKDRSMPFIHRLKWDLPHQSWDHSVTDGKATISWIVLNYTLGSFILLLYPLKERLIVLFHVDRIRCWAQVEACGRRFLLPPSHAAKGGEEQMDSLCTEAQGEILP